LITPQNSGDAIPPDVRQHVARALDEVAREHHVRILYAAESGSRAWGFGSPDSDFDVRFIYAHEPAWYLSLTDKRDVLERPLDAHLLDLAGWDVRKAMRLLLKSNPALYEWFVSPIVYADDGVFRAAAQQVFEAHASPRALAAHYWSIARGQWAREIDGRDQVKLKKYFYVVRPLLSMLSVIEHSRAPPMDIGHLLAAVPLPPPLARAIEDLLAAKRQTPELGLGDRIAAIDEWASAAIAQYAPENHTLPDTVPHDGRDAADRLFRQTIGLGDL
jgi:predicted nucleotidyltransferase